MSLAEYGIDYTIWNQNTSGKRVAKTLLGLCTAVITDVAQFGVDVVVVSNEVMT